MSDILNIDTQKLRPIVDQATGARGPMPNGMTTTNFTYPLTPPLRYPDLRYQVALIQLNTWWSYYNFSASYNNLNYSVDQGSVTALFLEPGRYDFARWVAAINELYLAATATVLATTFTVSNSTGKFTMTIPPGDSFSMSAHTAYMFGFAGGVYKSATMLTFTTDQTTIGISNWGNGITALNFTCDMTSNSRSNSVAGSIIAQFTPRAAAFGSIDFNPPVPLYAQINSTQFNSIAITITDNRGDIVDLNDEDVVATLHVKPFTV